MRSTAFFIVALSCFVVAPLRAQTDQAQEIAALRAQIALLSDRLGQIEQRAAERIEVEAEEIVIAPPPQQAIPEWTEKLRLFGDVRYRHEAINDDYKDFRNRHRVRARANICLLYTSDAADE